MYYIQSILRYLLYLLSFNSLERRAEGFAPCVKCACARALISLQLPSSSSLFRPRADADAYGCKLAQQLN